MRCNPSPFLTGERGRPAEGPLGERGAKVALIDERQFLRDCIASALEEATSEIEVFGFSAIDEIYLHELSLVVVWIESHGAEGVKELERLVREIRDRFPESGIAAFVHDSDRAVVKSAIAQGVCVIGAAKTTKDIATAAIRLACAGGVFTLCEFTPDEDTQLAGALAGTPSEDDLELESAAAGVAPPFSQAIDPACLASAAASASAICEFTNREREVLDHLNRGLQNKNIAFALGISDSTVKVHLRNIMKKLNATNRTQVLFLMRQLPNIVHARPV